MERNSFIPCGWADEIDARIARIASALTKAGVEAMLIADNTNLYYTSGRVFAGYTYITAGGECRYFVRRPQGYDHPHLTYIHKPEQIFDLLSAKPASMALLHDSLTVADHARLCKAFPGVDTVDGSAIMRQLRAIKSPFEQELLKADGVHHVEAYRRIPKVYRKGMSDIELQIEIEHLLRSEGCLGLFRIHGQSMELFMANVLCGLNADNASPYDFAMGGAGLDPSLPVGADGTIIDPGMTVMVDACGNFNGYMTDMTRCYYVGTLNDAARRAHEVSVSIHHRLAADSHAGTPAKQLYDTAAAMADEAGLADYFMGHNQKAGFVGHGLGIEINEAPVLAPRSRDVLAEGHVIAIEPKFVIPGVGAVGIENTYIVRADHLECITPAPESLTELYW